MEKKKVIVRPYQSSDASDLAKIYYHTIHEVNAKDYSEIQLDAWAPKISLEAERWAEKFAKTKPLVAVIDATPVGFAEFEPNGHIDCFYCHHEWIGFGVGSALMGAIHAIAHDKKIVKIFAEVSITARPFFEKWGFIVTEQQVVSIKGIELTNFKMEKMLV